MNDGHIYDANEINVGTSCETINLIISDKRRIVEKMPRSVLEKNRVRREPTV